jgi:hypothetical protein
MSIKKNVGLADRILRLGASLMMIYFGFIDKTAIPDQLASILLGGFGIIIFLTAIFSMCPLYNLIGISTYDNHDEH